MPGFGAMLTDEQIEAIIEYVRRPVMTSSPPTPRDLVGARAPRHPHRDHRRRRAVRQHLPDPRHEHRRPPRLPGRPRRPVRLDGHDGDRLVIYGIGLKGPEPSWAAVPGRTVLQDPDALYQAGVFDQRVEMPEGVVPRRGRAHRRPVRERGLGAAGRGGPRVRPGVGRGRRSSRRPEPFAAGEFQAVNVFDIGGERSPKINEPRLPRLLPRAALRRRRGRAAVPPRTEPGRAPAAPRSTRPASTSTCTWSATWAPGASRRSC